MLSLFPRRSFLHRAYISHNTPACILQVKQPRVPGIWQGFHLGLCKDLQGAHVDFARNSRELRMDFAQSSVAACKEFTWSSAMILQGVHLDFARDLLPVMQGFSTFWGFSTFSVMQGYRPKYFILGRMHFRRIGQILSIQSLHKVPGRNILY